jgi:hypothetical protein
VLALVAGTCARLARVRLGADADEVAWLDAADGLGADADSDADDLVARDDRERLWAPVTVDGVDVGVADAGVLDRDEDVVLTDRAALDGDRGQRLAGGRGCVRVDAQGDLLGSDEGGLPEAVADLVRERE